MLPSHGEMQIIMKFAMVGYKEKIDYVARVVIIQETCGVVMDTRGHPFKFSRGI